MLSYESHSAAHGIPEWHDTKCRGVKGERLQGAVCHQKSLRQALLWNNFKNAVILGVIILSVIMLCVFMLYINMMNAVI